MASLRATNFMIEAGEPIGERWGVARRGHGHALCRNIARVFLSTKTLLMSVASLRRLASCN